MKLIIVCVLLFISFNTFAEKKVRPYIANAKTISWKAYELSLVGDFFQTDGYFDTKGKRSSTPAGSTFRRLQGELTARYGQTHKFEIRIGGRARDNYSKSSTTGEKKNRNFESYFAGAKYSFDPISGWRSAIDFHIRQTAYSNTKTAPESVNTTSSKMVLGDDGMAAQAGIHLTREFLKFISLSGSVAYRIPANSLSHEVVYSGDLVFHGEHVALLLGVEGIQSMEQDKYSSHPSDKPTFFTGETTLYNSINRSYLAPKVGLNFAYSSVRFELFGKRVMLGTSTDRGYDVGAGITWNSSRGVSKDDLKVGKFKEYELEAGVIEVSKKGNFIKIDQGSVHGVYKGMKIDIYKSNYFGGNILVASGIVYKVNSSNSVVRVMKKYKKMAIETGFNARGY